MKGKGNSPLLRLRDKLFPGVLLRVETGDGALPFQKGDLVAQSLWIDGGYEDEDRALLRRVLPGFSLFIDVGANIGIYTLLAARHIMSGGRVVSFEPSPIEYAKLQKTIAWNRLTNVTAERAAVGAQNGTVEFYESTTGAGALNRVGSPAKDNVPFRKVTVPCLRLDDYFPAIPTAETFIKVDVEGFELPVLFGAENLLRRDRPTIMMEMVETRSTERSSPAQVWDFLVSLGYGWYVPRDCEIPFRPIAMDNGESRNLFAIHVDAVDRIIARLRRVV